MGYVLPKGSSKNQTSYRTTDGSKKRRPRTPVSVKLPAGKHTVVLTNPEFKISRTLPVVVLPNQTTRKRLDFN